MVLSCVRAFESTFIYSVEMGCDAVPFEEDCAVPDCAAPVVEAPRFDALKVDKLLCISVTSTTLP